MPSPPTTTARKQEGFGPMEMTVWQGPPLVGRERLSPAGAEAPERVASHRRPRRADRLRGTARRRRQSQPLGPRGDADRAEGGDRRRLRDQLPAAPDALRHRPGRASARARHRGRRQPAGRRRQPAGPSRGLRAAGLPAADHAERPSRASRARQIGVQWLVYGSGLGATNHFEACAFIRSRRRRPLPRPADALPSGGGPL